MVRKIPIGVDRHSKVGYDTRFARASEHYKGLIAQGFFLRPPSFCCPMCDAEYDRITNCTCGERTMQKSHYGKQIRERLVFYRKRM
jgi:hypothetical protein